MGSWTRWFIMLILLIPAMVQVTFPSHAQQSTPEPRLYLPVVMNMKNQYGPEIYTTSYYIKSLDPTLMYNRGCDLGKRDLALPGTQENLVILDFGGPRYFQNASGKMVYGTKLFYPGGRASTDEIAEAVKWYARGYYVCTGEDTTSFVLVGIGTNNYEYDGCGDYCAVNFAHGRAWAQMVNAVNQWLTENNMFAQVRAVGANDIELSWNDYTRTRDWLDGYDSVNEAIMINFGAIPGCPYLAAPGATCGSYRCYDINKSCVWTKEQVWYVIWGSKPVYPVPEIYSNNGVNAQQWYLMSVYGYTAHGYPVEFLGVLTQYQACKDKPGDPTCEYLDNTPLEGWTQLQSLLNGDTRVKHELKYSTDIRW